MTCKNLATILNNAFFRRCVLSVYSLEKGVRLGKETSVKCLAFCAGCGVEEGEGVKGIEK